MKKVIIFAPDNRLATILDPQGAPFGELVAAADERLDALGDQIRAFVAAETERMLAIHELGEEEMFGRARELGERASAVAEVAGAAGLDDVGEVANGIYAMVEGLLESGVWHSDALGLHLSVLRLMSSETPLEAKAREATLARLRVMRTRVGVEE